MTPAVRVIFSKAGASFRLPPSSLAIDGHLQAASDRPAAIHAFAHERHRDISRTVHGYHTAIAAERRDPRQRTARGGFQGLPAITHARRHVVSEYGAHEVLSGAGSRDGARGVVGVGTGANERGISHAPGHLGGVATG